MIPCKLTLYRAAGGGKVTVRHMYGQAETPPRVGHRFYMMTNELPPKTIGTGFISTIEWLKSKERCIFITDSSTYGWSIVAGENTEELAEPAAAPSGEADGNRQ